MALTSEKYTFRKKESEERNMFHVSIKADSNDGDYITEEESYTEDEFEEIVDELIDLNDNYKGFYKLEDFSSEQLCIPTTDYGDNCHTLTRLKIEYIDGNGEVYDVILRSGK